MSKRINDIIDEITDQYTSDSIAKLIEKHKNNSTNLVFILKNLGQLPINFDGSFLYELTKHKNSDVRLLAVKNIGKLVR